MMEPARQKTKLMSSTEFNYELKKLESKLELTSRCSLQSSKS